MKQFSNKTIRILAIETSCDETAAAVISGEITNHKSEIRNPKILSSVVSSQIDLHAKTGGVVPEVASRAHMESILPVISEALLVGSKVEGGGSNCLKHLPPYSPLPSGITHIAVTAGPGLIGSLLVGFNTAKSLAYSLDLPIIPVNHIEGHIYSAFAEQFPISNFQFPNKSRNPKSETQSNLAMKQFSNESKFPILALTVSGGHSSLTLMRDHGVYENLGQTLDDAAGEAFDKVAKLLDLGYPGGPVVSKLADQFRNRNESGEMRNELKSSSLKTHLSKLTFPRPILHDGTFNFSFSGLKTAVLTEVIKLKTKDYELPTGEICAAFEDAAVDVLTTKTMKAVEKYKPKGLILAGGVAANRYLRAELQRKVDGYNQKLSGKDQINLHMPPADMTGDNAAMIGLAAYYHILMGDVKRWNEIDVDSNFKL